MRIMKKNKAHYTTQYALSTT